MRVLAGILICLAAAAAVVTGTKDHEELKDETKENPAENSEPGSVQVCFPTLCSHLCT